MKKSSGLSNLLRMPIPSWTLLNYMQNTLVNVYKDRVFGGKKQIKSIWRH
ncbi:MAG: hypothetical protein IPP22_00495 [Nitrosomonas sp.]|nr:hypothetical protein [Nitrosomonas sp.]